MTDPFIIWTMRRTGGTSLASLLQKLAGDVVVRHEPFNLDREFGNVSRVAKTETDGKVLRPLVRDALKGSPPIKHCYDVPPQPITRVLLRITKELGYRHVVLDRADNEATLLSLALALQTGAWGKTGAATIYPKIESGEVRLEPFDLDMLKRRHHQIGALRRWLFGQMEEVGITPFAVRFEDLYGPGAAGPAAVSLLCRNLGIPTPDGPAAQSAVKEALFEKAQDSARLLPFVPNIEAARALLRQPDGTAQVPWPSSVAPSGSVAAT